MTENVLIALISAGGMSLTAITALVLNYHGFTAIQSRFTSIERRLELIEQDLKHFFHDKRITKLEP